MVSKNVTTVKDRSDTQARKTLNSGCTLINYACV